MRMYLVKTDEKDNIIGDGGNKILIDYEDVVKREQVEKKKNFWLGAGTAATLLSGVLLLVEPACDLYDTCVDKWKKHKENKKKKKSKSEED